MNRVVYYAAIPFIYLVALLPFPAVYLLSDFMYFVLYRLIGYRRKVVRQNLLRSFPEKKEEEIIKIEKEFYVFLCDLMLETQKMLTISKNEALKRCRFKDQSIFDRLYEQKKNVIIVMGHYGNWEWGGNTMALACKYQLCVIYKPLANEKFNELVIKMRTRFGAKPYSSTNVLREMLSDRHMLTATAFIADQTPPPENAYWMNFLNQDTPIFQGTEKIARKLNYAVVYAKVDRLKRGYYEISLELLSENPSTTADGEITRMHTAKLERDIIEKPAIWLWSHRRWKHKRPVKS
jgi:KDO2-lipid IV(A) lauroyltransferase